MQNPHVQKKWTGRNQIFCFIFVAPLVAIQDVNDTNKSASFFYAWLDNGTKHFRDNTTQHVEKNGDYIALEEMKTMYN